MNTQTTCVFVRLARISGAPVCVRARCAVVSQCVFDIYSGAPPVEQVSLESTTCSSAPTRAKEPPAGAHTHTRTHVLHLLPRGSDMVSQPARPLDGGRPRLRARKEKRREERRSEEKKAGRRDGELSSRRRRSSIGSGPPDDPISRGRLGARERQPYINPPNDFPLSGMCSVAAADTGAN